MDYKQQPRLIIFTNKYAGTPIKKKDGSFVEDSNGNPIKQGSFNGKINLPEGLPAGDYEVSIYKAIVKSGVKSGEEYMAGRIKKAYVKQDKPIDAHSQSKGNGYAPESNHVEESFSDEEVFF
jgi:hypothetical protein